MRSAKERGQAAGIPCGMILKFLDFRDFALFPARVLSERSELTLPEMFLAEFREFRNF